ncbi:hypothetical protein GCM10008916_25360 [Clostridium nitritogenes]|uniref:Uncharacterized protein n=1 Tax=Clostridium nitritogenes TaxID=83340 RepID=A0ABN1LTP1_9CLOT
MREDKIIQIIPATKNMYAVYKDGDSTFRVPIVCYALVEGNIGSTKESIRGVEPMVMGQDGIVDFVSDSNFIEISE